MFLAAVRSFRQDRATEIGIDGLLYPSKQFTPAKVANPAQIQSVRNNSKFALKASSNDHSLWRVESKPLFKTMLEGSFQYAKKEKFGFRFS